MARSKRLQRIRKNKKNAEKYLKENNINYKKIDEKLYIPYFYFDYKGNSIDVYIRIEIAYLIWGETTYFINSKIISDSHKIYNLYKNFFGDVDLFRIYNPKNLEKEINDMYKDEILIKKIKDNYVRYYNRENLDYDARKKLAYEIFEDLKTFVPKESVGVKKSHTKVQFRDGYFYVYVGYHISHKYWEKGEFDDWDQVSLKEPLWIYEEDFEEWIEKQDWYPLIFNYLLRPSGVCDPHPSFRYEITI